MSFELRVPIIFRCSPAGTVKLWECFPPPKTNNDGWEKVTNSLKKNGNFLVSMYIYVRFLGCRLNMQSKSPYVNMVTLDIPSSNFSGAFVQTFCWEA